MTGEHGALRGLDATIERRGLRDHVYDHILQLLLSGDAAPGERLSIDTIARQLDVSPTPVREAMVQLERTGLVTREALKGYRGWASGLRRDETLARKDIRVVEWDARRAMVKLNPIAAWTQDDVDGYIAEHGVLVNPLTYDGYGSIGCGPCTRRIKPGEDLRAGRWAGTSKTECGIHD